MSGKNDWAEVYLFSLNLYIIPILMRYNITIYLSSIHTTVDELANRTIPTLALSGPIVNSSTMLAMKVVTNIQLLQLVGFPLESVTLLGSLSQMLPELSTTNTISTIVVTQSAEREIH